jgi:hypothetical protein
MLSGRDGERADDRIQIYMRVAEWSLGLALLALLLPNANAKGIVMLACSAPILLMGGVLLFDLGGAIHGFKALLTQRNYAVMQVVGDWPTYFWRTVGLGTTLVGLSILGSGTALLVT